jgi:hypothetical protein
MIKRACLLFAFTLPLLAIHAGLPNPPQGRLFNTATTPTNGVNETQLLTFSGTISGGTFILTFNNRQTGSIAWSATNATLVSNIDTALEALSSIGSGGVFTAVRSMTAGIGTITVTFSGTKNAKLDVSEMTRVSSLTGSGAALAISTLTAGVTADGRNSNAGTLCVAQDSGLTFVNKGTPPNPSWVPSVFLATPTPTVTPTPTPTPGP